MKHYKSYQVRHLVEEAQRLVLPWLGDLELEGVGPVPLGPVGEGEDQAHGCSQTYRQKQSATLASVSARAPPWAG